MASIFKKFNGRGSVASVSSDFLPIESTRSGGAAAPETTSRRKSVLSRVKAAVGKPAQVISRIAGRRSDHRKLSAASASSLRSSLASDASGHGWVSEASSQHTALAQPAQLVKEEPKNFGPPPGVLKHYINEVVSAPGIVKIKHEFLQKLISGREANASQRQEAQRDVWRFHDALLTEAWDMNQRILEQKNKETTEREERARAAEDKVNNLKAQTVHEMTVIRDKLRKCPEGTQEIVQDVHLTVDTLEHLDEATRAVVKSCTEECIKGILCDAEQGREGLLWQMVRNRLEEEKKAVQRLLEQTKSLKQEVETLKKEKEDDFLRRPPEMQELESLKRELETWRTDASSNMTELALLKDENDQLRQENEQIGSLRQEIQRLKSQNTDAPSLEDLQPLSPLSCRVLSGSLTIGENPELQILQKQVKTLRTMLDQTEADLEAERQRRVAAEDALGAFSAGKGSHHDVNAVQDKEKATLLPSSVGTFLVGLAAVEDITALELLFKENGGCRMVRWAGLSFGHLAINWGEDAPEQEDTDACMEGASANRKSASRSERSDQDSSLDQLYDLQGADVGTLVEHAERLRKSFTSAQLTGTELLLGLERLDGYIDLKFMQEISWRCEDLKCDTAPHPLDLMADRMGQMRGEGRELRSLIATLLQAFKDTGDVLEQKRTAGQKASMLSKKVAQVRQQCAVQVHRCWEVATGAWKDFDALLNRPATSKPDPFCVRWKAKLLAELERPAIQSSHLPPPLPSERPDVVADGDEATVLDDSEPSTPKPVPKGKPKAWPAALSTVKAGQENLPAEGSRSPQMSTASVRKQSHESARVRTDSRESGRIASPATSGVRAPSPGPLVSQPADRNRSSGPVLDVAKREPHRSSESALKESPSFGKAEDASAAGRARSEAAPVMGKIAASKASSKPSGRLTKQTSRWHMMHQDQAAQNVVASDAHALATEMPVVGSAVANKKAASSPRPVNPKSPPKRAQTGLM